MNAHFEIDRIHKELLSTSESIAETNATVKNEHIQHIDIVEDLKQTIKKTNSDILAIRDGTYALAAEITKRQATQTLAMESKRKEIQADMNQWKDRITKEIVIHNYKVSRLEADIKELEQKKADVLKKNAHEMEEIESTLRRITEDYLTNNAILKALEQRLELELAEQKKLEEKKQEILQEEADSKALEEKQHFAALWIQLRWQAYQKRQLLKKQKKKDKGKKKKGGSKKKKN
jgi:hypothetical protein